MKHVIIRQLLYPKDTLLSKNKNIDRELQSLQQDGSYNRNRSCVYIYISRKRQFTDVSRARLSRLFRNTWPSKFHAAICSPSRNHFSLRSIPGLSVVIICYLGKLVRNKSFAWISRKEFGKKRSVIDDISPRLFWNQRSEGMRWMYVLWELMESVRYRCEEFNIRNERRFLADFNYFFFLFFWSNIINVSLIYYLSISIDNYPI